MDWGISVNISDNAFDDPVKSIPHKSTVNKIHGTPAYMSPEIARGDGPNFGPWTDVYLLGAILYEIITRHAPNKSKTLIETVLKASRGEPPVFSSAIPEELQGICKKAMAENHQGRYQTVTLFKQALEAYLSHRESLKISEDADKLFEKINQSSKSMDNAKRNQLYADLSDIIAGYRQALLLWSENYHAKAGEKKARFYFAGLAKEQGDLGLAKTQVQQLSGHEAHALDKNITAAIVKRDKMEKTTRTLRRSVITASVLIMAFIMSTYFALSAMEKVGFNIATQMQTTLINDAMETLENFAKESANAMTLNLEKLEIALQSYAFIVENHLNNISEGLALIRPVVFSRDIDKGVNLPGKLQEIERYQRIDVNGKNVANPVSFESQSFFVPTNVDKAMLMNDIVKIQRALPFVKKLHGDRTKLIVRYITGLDSGLFVMYPAAGNVNDKFDPRNRPWYIHGKKAGQMMITPPYRSASTRKIVFTYQMPIADDKGQFKGVVGVDSELMDLLYTARLPKAWAKKAEVKVVKPSKRKGMDSIIVIAEQNYQSQNKISQNQYDVKMDHIEIPENTAFNTMVENMRNGRSGVAHVHLIQSPYLWSYSPLGVSDTYVLIMVPESVITQNADKVKHNIKTELTHHLWEIAKFIVILLSMVLVVTLVIMRLIK